MTHTVTEEPWCFDIDEAPQGRLERREKTNKKGEVSVVDVFIAQRCIIATRCEKVIISHRLENGRWSFLSEKELPVAWKPRPVHPFKLESTQ